VRDPFSQKHSLKTEFYSATNGLSLEYTGIFKKALKGWDLELHGLYTTPHFTQNFFGLSNESSFDKEKFEERIAKLSGGVAVISVGAATETEMKERKALYEDALHATRAALAEGIVPGGGVALLRARCPGSLASSLRVSLSTSSTRRWAGSVRQ
jgi:hypothetical protein